MEFERPVLLWALAGLPVLALLWWRACRCAADVQRVLAEERPTLCGVRNAARGACRLAAFAALVVGMAGPVRLVRNGSPARVPVAFILDVSASMSAADVAPDRLAAARSAVEQMDALLPDAAPALVAVAQDAVVVCPFTDDRDAFLALLSQARTDWTSHGGTRLASALGVATDLLERDGRRGVIVLVSDGEDHGGELDPAVKRARRAGHVLHTVAVGSEEGAALAGHRTGDGQQVITRAHVAQMARWAEAGNGRAWSVSPRGWDLPTEPAELTPGPLATAARRASPQATSVSPILYALAAVLLATGEALPWALRRRRAPAPGER